MTSFILYALGYLAADPEVTTESGRKYTRFCLIGLDWVALDASGNATEKTTSVRIAAFGTLGTTLAELARKDDQLFVQARVTSNNDYSYIAESFTICTPANTTPAHPLSVYDQALAEYATSWDDSETAAA